MAEKAIAVLGGGNGALTMAADLVLGGHRVRLYQAPDFAAHPDFEPVLRERRVVLEGIGRTGVAELEVVSTGMGEVVDGVDLVNVVVPANAHETFFEALIPHLRDGQTVVVWPGNFGSLRLLKMLKDRGVRKDLLIAETNTLPYGTRRSGPGRVRLLLAAPRVLISALPGSLTQRVVDIIRPIFPCIVPCDNVIATALSNPNPIIHPPGSLLNVGRIEYSKGEFWMYREGITHSVAKVIRRLYSEAEAVARALGSSIEQYEERDFWTTASVMGVAFQAPFDTLGVIASIAGPHSVHDRYITEDLPYGLVPLAELGRKLGVPTPVAEGIVNIGSVVCGEDYWRTGNTLTRLGLAGMSREEIVDYVKTKAAL